MARRPSSVRPSVNFCANRFFSQTNGRIATKLALDGLQVSLHPGCAQGQGQGQRSRDARTFLDSWNELSGVVSGTTVRALVPGRFGRKKLKSINLKDTTKEQNISKYNGGLVLWAADVCFRAGFAQPGSVSSISLGQFFLVRVRRNVTLLSICSRVSCLPHLTFFQKKEWSYRSSS